MASKMLSFFGSNKEETGSDEDFLEASEGLGNGHGNGGILEGSGCG